MKIGIVAITGGGLELATKLATEVEDAELLTKNKDQKIAEILAANWRQYEGFICIMAAGIVVRSIAPLLEDKHTDPCVLVLDEMGRHAISLLSGHLGGGNALARKIAKITNGTAVITTASDTLGLVALDLWAKDQHLVAPSRDELTKLSTRLVNQGQLALYTDVEVSSLPAGLMQVKDPMQADFIVSHFDESKYIEPIFSPKNLVVGIGCNRGASLDEFDQALTELLKDLQLSITSIRNLASIDKKNDEIDLLQFAKVHHWQIDFFTSKTINTLNNLEISFAALKAVGAIGVAEPAALLSAQSNVLLCRKRKWKNVTMAVAQVPFTLSAQAPVQSGT